MFRLLSALNRLTENVLSDPVRRFQLSLLSLVGLVILGAITYTLIEGWVLLDSLYMTIITITTVGFAEVRPLTESGRVFTIILIVLGIGVATTAISNAVSLALGPVLLSSLQTRRMQRMVEDLERHYIVAGYGRMGRQIVRDLQARNEAFVLIDSNADLVDGFQEDKILHIIGDATTDEALYQAGIERAMGFVGALDNDASNIMAVLTARELNPGIFIVARVVRPESESKLYRAGADRVVNPYQIGGHRMTLSLLRPAVHDFMDRIFHFGEIGQDIDIGQLTVYAGTALSQQTVGTCDLRQAYRVTILAIRQPDGGLLITPGPDTLLPVGATLIIIGPPEDIYELERENLADAPNANARQR